MRYFFIVSLLTAFVIGLVWQNLEVVKIKMEYKKLGNAAENLYKSRDLLLYNIERYKKLDIVENKAKALGFREVAPDNVVIINASEINGNKDENNSRFGKQ